MKKITAVLTAMAFAAAALAPTAAVARDRHGGYYGGGHYDNHRHYRRHRDDDGAAIAAGVVGLALGLALGAAASNNNQQPRARCYDNYQRCEPAYGQSYYAPQQPPSSYQGDYYGPPQGAYYDGPSGGGYYEGGNSCVRQVEQWDPHSRRYVWVNLRTPC